MITSREIWKDVLEGRVQQAIASTRTYRMVNTEGLTEHRQASSDPVALFLEPSLTSNIGHHFNLALCYERLLNNLGYRTVVIHAYKNALAPRQDWHPHFLVPHHTLAFRAIESYEDLERVKNYFTTEFGDIINRYDPRLCVFGTIRFTNVVGAALALTNNRARPCRQAIFGVMEAQQTPDCHNPAIVRSAFTQAASMLRAHRVPHMLIVETDYIRDFLISCGFSQKQVKLYPYVAAKHSIDTTAVSKGSDGQVQIGYVGASRPVRNPELMADLLLLEAFPESIRWSVQFDLNYLETARGKSAVQRLQAMHKDGMIRLYSTGLDEQDYSSLFGSLDFVVLPYSERYRQIGSGVLIEAIYFEVIPILPRASSMNNLYASLGGDTPTFEVLSTAAIKAAIADGLSRLKDLKKAATAIRRRWSQHPSATEQWQADLTTWLSG